MFSFTLNILKFFSGSWKLCSGKKHLVRSSGCDQLLSIISIILNRQLGLEWTLWNNPKNSYSPTENTPEISIESARRIISKWPSIGSDRLFWSLVPNNWDYARSSGPKIICYRIFGTHRIKIKTSVSQINSVLIIFTISIQFLILRELDSLETTVFNSKSYNFIGFSSIELKISISIQFSGSSFWLERIIIAYDSQKLL